MTRLAEVEGADGVRLAVHDRGSGVPVVLVHGTSGSAADWALVGRLLQDRCRVLRYDRRGRGGSTDAAAHSLDAEVEDLLAVLTAVGEPAHLVAHSYGALVALLAAARGAALRSLVLYEPPVAFSTAVPEEQYRAVQDADARQDWQAVLDGFHELAGFSAEERALLRGVALPLLLDAAPTVAREHRVLRPSAFDLRAAAAVGAPTTVLLGELTDARLFLDGLDDLAAALRAPVLRVPGQRHLGLVMDPAGFVALLPLP